MNTISGINFSTIFIIIVGTKICTAHWDGAYMRNPTDGFMMKTRWLSTIRDDVKLQDIAFPGTETSGAFDANERSATTKSITAEIIKYFVILGIEAAINDAMTTQALNFEDQLNYGIRVLDIQVYPIKDTLILTYGYSHLGMGFDTVLYYVESFLKDNPTETVLINLYVSERIKPLGGYKNKLTMDQILDSYLNTDNLRKFYLKPNSLNITLGEARGKFILMSRETVFYQRTLNLITHANEPWMEVNSIIMDKTYLSTNWDLYWEKWIPVKAHLSETVDSNDNKTFIVYVNGWGGSFPYFVASGHSSPQTSAPRLATGATTPGFWWKYPDFPRLNCLGKLCTISFEGVNVLTRDLIRQINNGESRRTVGIVLMNFPGEDLIDTIITNNNRLKKDWKKFNHYIFSKYDQFLRYYIQTV